MFSVIIPTLWRSEKTRELLISLNKCPKVGEIVIIDNYPKGRPEYVWKLGKVRMLGQERNIYVNPAWNLGVKESINENLCICNDDVVFDTSVFDFIHDYMDIGIIGQWTDNYYLTETKDLKIERITGRPSGWGCLMFVKKSNWVDIPKNLLIACGDDFLINHVKGGGWKLTGFKIDTRMSTTSLNPEFKTIQENDIKNYNND